MARNESLKVVTLEAGEDLTAGANYTVTMDANGRVVATDAVTDVIVGTVVHPPTTAAAGSPVSVALVPGGGIANMIANGAIVRGHLIVPTAVDGKVAGVANIAALVANQMAAGFALEAAVANQIFEVLVMPIAGPNA